MDLAHSKFRIDPGGKYVAKGHEDAQNLQRGVSHDGNVKARGDFNMSKVAICLVLLAMSMLSLTFLDGDKVKQIVYWLSMHQRESALIFVGFGVFATMILFPGSVLCMAAGAAYGVALGSCLVWVAIVIGQTIAFGLGRYIFRDFVVHHACQKIANFQAIDSAIAKSGWKFVVLLRLSPFIPYNLLNYALSVTGIGLAQFTIASSLSVIPWIFFLTYLGSVTRSAVMDSAAEGFKLDSIGWVPWCLSLIVTALSLFGISIITKRAICQALLQASKHRDIETQKSKVCETGQPL